MLSKIMEGLQKYFKRMPTAVRVKVDGSWSCLKDRLERPWVGRITEVLERRKFIIRWYQRHGRSLRFHAMFNDDKTPYQSLLENQSVMMWDISVERTQNSFHLTPYKLSKILKEYKKYDQQLLKGDPV